jgi:hypothetical protein
MPALVKLVTVAPKETEVDIDLVPFLVAEGVKIAEGCDLCPAGIVDNNIKTSKSLHSLLNQADTIFYRSDILCKLCQRALSRSPIHT